MAAKLSMAAFGGAHTAGIFSDMTVDGPVIGTLVAIIDRARNLPNKRTMGKQDPYCAARLGKEAKKTHTDKRGGQTPKWDQELRFTVHDSPDYHRIKVSVFNDDRKTELIGDTFIALHTVITPGGGQSDGWHTLDCKGKYAGEIRIEFTYYDTRPKADKPAAEKKRETSHPDAAQSPAVGGPRGARESTPIKRRPLPSDPTAAASPSPVTTPEPRGLQGVRAGPRELGSPRHRQEPARRPVPDTSASPVQHGDAFDMSYAAPKPYEVKPYEVKPVDAAHARTLSHDDARSPLHSHSAPVLPTQHTYAHDPYAHDPYAHDPYAHDNDNNNDNDAYHVAPLRSSRSNLRRQSAMQPTVEDEDFDLPPPPPAHRKDAATLPHKYARHQDHSPEPSYELQRQPYAAQDYDYRQPAERRYTHPRPTVQSNSRPVSRDTMAPSPLRQETSLPAALVAGLDASRRDSSYQAPPAYETPSRPAYETASSAPLRLRQYSEPADYGTPPQYTAPVQPHELVHYQAQPPHDSYYEHDPPEEPRRRSPMEEFAPIYKPRAHSPNPSPRHSPNPAGERASRMPGRSMPARKSVSPRPPPDDDFSQRRLSGVPFGPDDFNVLNPSLAKPAGDEPERPGSSMEYNDKGQIVTFSGRVVDASDHLPVDNWAPEPEPKGNVKEKAPRIRAQLNGSRNLQEAQVREDKYRRDREERDRIRSAADITFGSADAVPSQALVMTRRQPDFDPSNALVLSDRDHGYDTRRPQSRGYESTTRSREALRERHTPNSYGSYGSRHAGAPPIPAKIPLDRGMQNEDAALSLELQSIDIGPGGGARRPRTRGREYSAYI
ncbi:hypothetical protein M3J07_004773 [Ascochyta lentis]